MVRVLYCDEWESNMVCQKKHYSLVVAASSSVGTAVEVIPKGKKGRR